MPTINFSDDVLSEFRTEVLRKHGKLYHVLKQEGESALVAWTKKLKEENNAASGETIDLDSDPLAGLIGKGSLKGRDHSTRKDWRA